MTPDIPFRPAEDWSALLAPAALAARRFGGRFGVRSGARRIRVLERVALSRRAALLVVEFDGRSLLVGQSGDRLSLLSSDSAAPATAPPDEPR